MLVRNCSEEKKGKMHQYCRERYKNLLEAEKAVIRICQKLIYNTEIAFFFEFLLHRLVVGI